MKFRNVVLSGAALLLAGTLSACGSKGGLSGEYGQSEAGQWFTILDFQGGDQVTLVMIGSEDRHSGTYTLEGDTVTVTAAGESRTLKLDGNGCLDGGPGNSFFSGVVCKKP
jgi:hypothetical protein